MARRWRPTTLAGSLALALQASRDRRVASEAVSMEDKYRDNPEAFAVEVLGVQPIKKQCEILMALVPEGSRVSVRSSHKAGKTTTAAIAAIWFYATRQDGRVICIAPTHKQLQDVLYREVRRLLKGTLVPIPGEVHKNIQNGVRHPDGLREIMGVNASDPHNIQGYSGAQILFLGDEASGIGDPVWESLEGNAAGIVRFLLTSNPTKCSGYFYRSQKEHSHLWTCFALSAYDSPNVTGESKIPGLATQEWIDRMLAMHGPKGVQFLIRVKGEFAESAEDRIISTDLYVAATDRWDETPAVGSVVIGCDPSGPGWGGDESAFAVRVGAKVVSITGERGMGEDDFGPHVKDLILQTRAEHPGASKDLATLVVDSEGAVGAKVYAALVIYSRLHPNDFKVIRVRSSEKAKQYRYYHRVADELWSNLYDALSRPEDPHNPAEGPLALPVDRMLEEDLAAQSWIYDRENSRQKITPKDKIRQRLKRSPDRADAVCLCVWSRPARSQAARQAHEQGRRRRELPSPYGGLGY